MRQFRLTEGPMIGRDETAGQKDDRKAWQLLEKTLLASVEKQRRARSWGICFKRPTFLCLFGVLFLVSPLGQLESGGPGGKPHTALIEVRGTIADRQEASADNLVTSLRRAFKDGQTRAVVLRINSPGGSPVQAGYVYDEIRRLRD